MLKKILLSDNMYLKITMKYILYSENNLRGKKYLSSSKTIGSIYLDSSNCLGNMKKNTHI